MTSKNKQKTGRFLIELLFQFLSLRSHILVSGYNNVPIVKLAHTPLRFPSDPDILHSFLRNPIMCGPFDYTFQDFINDASPEEWAEWEQKSAELEVTVDYYVQEFI